MLYRICYTIKKFWQYRNTLNIFLKDSSLQLKTINDLNKSELDKYNIKLLILDYDGVLAFHGDSQPRPEIIKVLKKFIDYPIYIFSNDPKFERSVYFTKNFTKINFLFALRKKPYPDEIYKIIKKSQVKPENIMLIDDRLATGIVLAIDMGLQAKWITKPYINLLNRPFSEFFLILLRRLEIIACKFNFKKYN